MLRGWRRWAAIAIGGLSLYSLVGFFVVPWIARSQIEKRAHEALGRQVRVERVRFNPFTFVAEVTGIDIRDRDGTDLLALDRLHLNLQTSGVFRRAWRFADVEIDRPRVVFRILENGSPAITDLFVGDDAAAPEADVAASELDGAVAPEAVDEPFPRLIVDRLVLREGHVAFIDEARQPRFDETLAPLDLEVHDLTTLPAEGGDHAITVGVGPSARIRWTGRQTLEPLDLSGRFEVTGIRLERLWSYAAPSHPLDVHQGTLDLAWSYAIRRGADDVIGIAVEEGSVMVHGVAVRPRDGTEDWLSVPEAEARSIRAAWPASTVEIGEIRVSRPHAVVAIAEDAQLNWQVAATAAPSLPAEPAAGDEALPWGWKIGAVEIVDGSVAFEDRSVVPIAKLAVADTALRFEKLSSDLTAPVTARASSRVDAEGRIEVTGSFVPQPASGEIDLSVRGLDLAPLRGYAAVPHAELHTGVVSLAGKVRVTPEAPRLTFDGDAGLDRLDVVDPGSGRLLAWEGSRARGIQVAFEPQRVKVREIELDRAFVRILIDREARLNLAQIGVSDAAAVSDAPAAPLPAVDVTTIALADARIDFTDESLILPFGTDIHSAHGVIRDLSTRSPAPARLELEGRVADTGYVEAHGTLRVADPFSTSDVSVTFRDVSMPALTPYVAEFAGYSVEDGNLDLDLHYRIEDRHLVGDHRVVAKDLVLGPKVEGADAPGLPIRLAIALLKDKDGRIDLAVPIEGTVDAPEFAYRKLFWQAARKILAHAAAAPFRALGRLFGKDEEDLDLVGFVSGRSELPPPEQETLAKLAVELAQRPGLTVEIAGSFDPLTDPEAIRRARLEQRIETKRATFETQEAILEALFAESFSAERLEIERMSFMPAPAPIVPAVPEEETKKRKKRASEPSPPPVPVPAQAEFDAAGFYDALRAQLLAAEEVSEAELADLARARAAAIAGALAGGGVDPARVKANDPSPVKRKKRGSDLVASEMTLSAGD